MTLIECFTDSPMDNIAACLRLRPEKMIVVGDAAAMGAAVQRYRNLLQRRGWPTEIEMCDVGGMDFRALCGTLRELVQREEECVLDLTGGDELTAMAFGAVAAGLDPERRRKIRVEKFDHSAGSVINCIDRSRIPPAHPVKLTVEELVMLHGGSVQHDGPGADADLRDIEGLWRIASEAPKEWNRIIAYLNEFESRAELKPHETRVCLRLGDLGRIGNFEQKESAVRNLLEKMHRYGIVEDRSSRDVLDYTYRSPLLRQCTQKAGNVLEMKTLLEGRSVLRGEVPLFHDCRMSVTIDWDGVALNPRERLPETRNEIDVVLMRGMTPLFISCKNGSIGEEELYKLNTVAQRFGGPRGKKMLIATDLDQKSVSANRAFTQRAWDMDIFLVPDAGELTETEWKQIFVQAIE